VSDTFAQAVYALVRLIPPGQVATYSQVGTYLGSPGLARAVGNALRDLGPTLARDVPWHRVIKANGTLAARGDLRRMPLQARLLRQEGVTADPDGRIPLALFGWTGPRPVSRPSGR
jgi:methylated-DNA-protein-cysteine methyltransferase-like protein